MIGVASDKSKPSAVVAGSIHINRVHAVFFRVSSLVWDLEENDDVSCLRLDRPLTARSHSLPAIRWEF